MSFSIQTNVNSLIAQENLRVNSNFQSRTIERLTSGYRINSSGDDAAGLAIANSFRSDSTELTQGVRNANDGISALQIVDGGLNNVSKILDRLKTLATQSASGTFTGDRNTLDTEYQALLTEIDRQATNIGMVEGGKYNADISVYIGGGANQANASISVELSGAANRVDSKSLGVGGSSILGASTGLTNNTQLITDSVTFLKGSATAPVETFTFSSYESNALTSFSVALTGGTAGLTSSEALASLNSQLASHNIRAIVNSDHKIAFAASQAFTVRENNNTATTGGTALATTNTVGQNEAMFRMPSTGTGAVNFQTFGTSAAATVQFVNANGTVTVTLNGSNAGSTTAAVDALNSKLSAYGIYAVLDVTSGGGVGITLQSKLDFSVSGLGFCSMATDAATGGAVFGMSIGQLTGTTVTSPTDASSDSTSSAKLAISAIKNAVTVLGGVQGKIGTAQNKLQYAISLAQSQMSGFAAAESRIRDTDVAAEAANLTKAQVLQQASMAAMAQANSAPQAVLSLLRG